MRISDWSSDVCSSDLRGPVSQHQPGRFDRLDRGVGLWHRRFEQFPLFDLGQKGRLPADQLARLGHVLRPLDKAERDPIDIMLKRKGEVAPVLFGKRGHGRLEEHTSELQSLMRTSYAVFCFQKKTFFLIAHI